MGSFDSTSAHKRSKEASWPRRWAVVNDTNSVDSGSPLHHAQLPLPSLPRQNLAASSSVPFLQIHSPFNFPSLNCPTHFLPSGVIMVPSPWYLPFLNSPTYLPPPGRVKAPGPSGLPYLCSPTYLEPSGAIRLPLSFTPEFSRQFFTGKIGLSSHHAFDILI
jgi:hypothetical protein